jgi:hypothetical protein
MKDLSLVAVHRIQLYEDIEDDFMFAKFKNEPSKYAHEYGT